MREKWKKSAIIRRRLLAASLSFLLALSNLSVAEAAALETQAPILTETSETEAPESDVLEPASDQVTEENVLEETEEAADTGAPDSEEIAEEVPEEPVIAETFEEETEHVSETSEEEMENASEISGNENPSEGSQAEETEENSEESEGSEDSETEEDLREENVQLQNAGENEAIEEADEIEETGEPAALDESASGISIYEGTDDSGEEPVAYTLTFDQSTGTITDYSGKAARIVVPAQIDGVAVTKIGDYVFGNYYEQAEAIRSVSLPEGLTTIGKAAFFGCRYMEEVNIPSTVTVLGEEAFSNCYAINNSLDLSNVETIGSYAFAWDSGLTSVTLSEKIDKIAEGVFCGCGLTELTVPSSVTEICTAAFSNCEKLEQITLPEGVIGIGERAFAYSGLKTLVFPDSLAAIGKRAFAESAIESIEIPSTVTEMDTEIFYSCRNLASVVLPDGLTAIPESMFQFSGIRSVVIPDSVTTIGKRAFYGAESLSDVTLPESVSTIEAEAFRQARALKSIAIPAGVTVISDGAFLDCTGLESVELPSALQVLEKNAFANCIALTEAVLPDGTTTIGADAFSCTYALKHVSIPDSVTSIGSRAFYRTETLEEITIPGSVTTIETRTFDASGVKSVVIGDGVASIGDYAFNNCPNLTEVKLPEKGMTRIGGSAFALCLNLVSIMLPEGLETIGSGAFAMCESLPSINIPEGVTSIESNAFSGTSSLSSITVPGTVKNIPEWMLSSSGVRTVVLEDGVESIGKCAFDGCGNIEVITIPASVTSIYDNVDGVFDRSNADMLIRCYANSYAAEYAEMKHYAYELIDAQQGLTFRLTVKDEADKELTEGFSVNWYEKDSEETIGTGLVLQGADEEKQYEYELLLGDELAKQYVQPGRRPAETDEEGTLILALTKLERVIVTGKLLDGKGQAVSDAAVTALQSFNGAEGTLTEELSAVSGEDGIFSMELKAVPTDFSVKKEGYYSIYRSENLENASEKYDIGRMLLTELVQDRVILSLTLVHAAPDGETAETETLDSAERFSFRLTHEDGTEIKGFEIQKTSVVFAPGTVEPNETIAIHMSDPDGSWADAHVNAALGENRTGSAEMILTENGRFLLGTLNGAEKITMTVFDAGGKNILAADARSRMESDPMEAGTYQILLMEKNSMLRTVPKLSLLDELGLKSGEDYILRETVIEPGRLTEIGDITVPKLDEDAFRCTVAENTYVNASVSEVGAGTSFLLRAAYEIDSAYNAESQSVRIVLPEGISLYQDGVTVDGKACAYTEDESGIVVNISGAGRSHVVRLFCLAVETGVKDMGAYLSFRTGETDVMQSIGTAQVNVASATLSVPATTGKDRVKATGTAIPDSVVTVYDTGTSVGTATANKVGSWSLDFNLVNPYNYSYHTIYAVIEADGSQIRTADSLLIHDTEANVATMTRITMYNYGHTQNTTVFDFTEETESKAIPYYLMNGNYPTFTFKAEFEGDASQVEEAWVVTANSRKEITYVELNYDESQGVWYGTHDYTYDTAPAYISGSYRMKGSTTGSFDEQRFLDTVQGYLTSVEQAMGALKFTMEEEDDDSNYVYALNEELSGSNCIAIDLKARESSEDEAETFCTLFISGEKERRTQEELIGNGFEDVDGTGVYYVRTTLTGTMIITEYVDLSSGECLTETYMFGDPSYDAMAALGDGSFVSWVSEVYSKNQQVMSCIADIAGLIPVYGEFGSALQSAIQAGGDAIVWTKDLNGNISVLQIGMDTVDTLLEATCDDGERRLDGNLYIRYKAASLGIQDEIAQYKRKGLASITGVTALVAVREVAGRLISKGAAKGIENKIQNSKLDDATKEFWTKSRKLHESFDKKSTFTNVENAYSVTTYVLGEAADQVGQKMQIISGWVDEQSQKIISSLHLELTTASGLENYINSGFQTLNQKIEALEKNIMQGYRKCGGGGGNGNGNGGGGGGAGSGSGSGSGSGGEGLLVRTDSCRLDYIADPSGYVYEAVESNRLEGVTATVYYKDENGEAQTWDAEAYDQANPQVTGNDGIYAWDVPEGKWKIVFTKDGYETADTSGHENSVDGWLPVAPPQVEINIGMVSLDAPEVTDVAAFEDSVQITFSQYMDIDSVKEAVSLFCGGTQTVCEVAALDEETGPDGTVYATRFRIAPEDGMKIREAELRIGTQAKNYAGNALETDYVSEELSTSVRPEKIDVRGALSLKMNETADVTVKLEPALEGQTLKITSLMPDLASVLTEEEVKTDADGNAVITVKGLLPGTGLIQITEPVSGLTQTMDVIVVGSKDEIPEVTGVKAELEDGTELRDKMEIKSGTKIVLSTAEEGGQIRYTLDDTCPCKASALVYDGPISVSENTVLRAAVLKNGTYSDTCRFELTVTHTHTFGAWQIQTAASCTKEGVQIRFCTVDGCAESETKAIPRLAHTWKWVILKDDTCGQDGSRQQKCSICGAVGSTETIKATGNHSYGNYQVTKEATALAEGLEIRTCSRCKAEQTRTVAKLTPVLKLSATSIPLKVKQSTTAVKVTELAKGDYVKSWKSSNTSIAKVSKSGKITAQKKTGSAVVTVTLASGKTAKVKVKVQKSDVNTTKVTVSPKKVSVQKGKKVTLAPSVQPLTSLQKVSYKSSNTKIATVTSKGVVKGVKAGTAKITIQSGTKKATVTVTVTKVKTTKITNVKESLSLKKGKTASLKPKLSPANSDDKITYSSSDKKVATVDKNGKITAKKKGTTIITIKSGSVKKTCKVTVK